MSLRAHKDKLFVYFILYKSAVILLILVSITFIFKGVSFASSSDTSYFQGKIVIKANGLNISENNPSCVKNNTVHDDTCDFKVGYYSEGTGGTLLWQEDFFDVELGDNNGIFSLALGSGENGSGPPLNSYKEIFKNNSNVYMQISFDVDGNDDFSDPEIFTTSSGDRMQIRGVPYAITSEYLSEQNNQFIKNQEGQQTSSNFNIDGNGKVGGIFSVGVNNSLYVNSAINRVGIGTTNPSTLFQIGTPGSLEGALSLAGATSGLVTIKTSAATDNWTLVLPSSAGSDGYVLTTNGSGVTSWSPINSMGIGNSVTSGTSGSLLFVNDDGNLSQNNSKYFWDETNNRLGIGTNSSLLADLHIYNSSSATLDANAVKRNQYLFSNYSGDDAGYDLDMIGSNIVIGRTTSTINSGSSIQGIGISSTTSHTSGNFPEIYGLNAIASHTGSGGTVTSIYGAKGVSTNLGNGATVTNSYGVMGYSGTSTGATITNGYGVFGQVDGTNGTVTNAYGGYFSAVGTNAWALYANAGNNYLNNKTRIGTTDISSENLLEVAGTTLTQKLKISSIDTSGGGTNYGLRIDSDGNVYRDSSSSYYKENIIDYTDNYENILSIVPKQYNFVGQNTSNKEIGYIAEDLNTLGLTGLVIYDNQGKPDGVKYEKIPLYILEVVKSQQKQIGRMELTLANMGDGYVTSQLITINDLAASTIQANSISTNKFTAIDAEISGVLTTKKIITNIIEAGLDSNISIILSENLGKTGLEILDSIGSRVFGINSKGDVDIKGKINFTAENINRTVGTDNVPAGESSIIIESTAITPESKVLITLKDDSDVFPLLKVIRTELGKFEVKIDITRSIDTLFDWFVIN